MVLTLAILALDVTVQLNSRQGPARLVSLPLEQYVAGVIAGEAASLPLEPRKAMAVAARTYAVRFRGRHAREGFDFCDTTHCQDYRGVAIEARSQEAADSTTGELLWRNGQLVETYYTRSCGDRWERVIPVRSLPGILAPGEYAASGRLATVRWNGRLLDATTFRWQAGTALLPSNWFTFERNGDYYLFRGQGQGHGEGLCQLEAARSPASYREILERYYPQSILGLTASGIRWRFEASERIELWVTRPEPQLLPQAERLLSEAESLARFSSSRRIRIRLYPTLTLYRDATGQSGVVAAFTEGTRISLPPLPPPQRTAVLGHELLHAVLESRSAPGHPWWFREGLVLALRGERPADPRYQEALRRVQSLLARHGRDRVLGWWRSGLPRQGGPGGMDEQPREQESQRHTGDLPANPRHVRDP